MRQKFLLNVYILLIILFISKSMNANIVLVPREYPTIQSAINASLTNDTILVSQGVYYENINFLGMAIVVKADGPAELVIINGSRPVDPNSGSVV